MKDSAWKRIVRPILSTEEAWAFRGGLAYRRRAGWILSGVLGEGSAFDTGVFIWAVRMPLFVPTDVVDLSWSTRVGGGSTLYHADDATIGGAVKEALDATHNTGMDLLTSKHVDDRNVRLLECKAYGLIILGRPDQATACLRRVAEYPSRHDWEEDLTRRASGMLQILQEGDNETALARLRDWKIATVAALGLQSAD
jgi:hypothetical protein